MCDKGNREIQQLTLRGKISLIAASASGRMLICPNFSVFDAHGNLHFSDSGTGNKATV
jgi:sugar lactone lactonase YvrE